MYFPYLYGKRSELLALRSLAGELGNSQRIVPIIEPVAAAQDLIRFFGAFKDAGDYAYVVENPNLLDLKEPGPRAAWLAATASQFADRDVFRPAFKVHKSTTSSDISGFVARHSGRPVGLVVASSHLASRDIRIALGKADYLAFLAAEADRVGLVSELGASRVVEVNDRFPAQRINADYAGEEWFSRDHLDYTTHGYPGFSDYTVLPSEPAKGGGQPGAVAAHLTFKATDSSLWVEHFVSDETDRNVGDAGSKLLETADHIAFAVTTYPGTFDKSPALDAYLEIARSRANSSLGNNKKLEIAHHLFVVARRLGI